MTKEQGQKIKEERLGSIRKNNKGELMKVIEYNSYSDVVVEFQDEYKERVHTAWNNFIKGGVKNPYCKSIYDVGYIGKKYEVSKNGIHFKEYDAWHSMMQRCYDKKYKNKNITYQDVTCCEEWLLYENFYEWLHSQENFEKWLNGKHWAVDKDILVKGNKIYSPDTCCLVPQIINTLFIKKEMKRGLLPIGVQYDKRQERYVCRISMMQNNKGYLREEGRYPTPEDAFYLGYKPAKERYIQRIAQEEYEVGNITKRCYDAMMNYKVEITD